MFRLAIAIAPGVVVATLVSIERLSTGGRLTSLPSTTFVTLKRLSGIDQMMRG